MVCIEKRDKRWRALVRKKGYQPVSRTFATKTAATRRAKQTGGKIENRSLSNVGDLIDRYIDEFSSVGSKPGSPGIEDLHFHELSHEGTSRLFEAGYRIQGVAPGTGHKDWKMLSRYTPLKVRDLHR